MGTPDQFLDRKRFVVEAVVHAASREVAYRLPYYPNPEREAVHRECLRQFALMVHHFDPSRTDEPAATGWPYLFPPTATVCELHRLFRHELGCMVCPNVFRPSGD